MTKLKIKKNIQMEYLWFVNFNSFNFLCIKYLINYSYHNNMALKNHSNPFLAPVFSTFIKFVYNKIFGISF